MFFSVCVSALAILPNSASSLEEFISLSEVHQQGQGQCVLWTFLVGGQLPVQASWLPLLCGMSPVAALPLHWQTCCPQISCLGVLDFSNS